MISLDRLTSAVEQAAASPQFGNTAWLTFYLIGNESNLAALALDLSTIPAENLDGAEGGFIYAKVPVKVDAADIEAVAEKVVALAHQHKVDVDHVDLDSAPDVTVSKFFCVTGGHR